MNLVDVQRLETILCATVTDKPELLDDINLTHEDFENENAGLVFRTITWLKEKGKPITPFTVTEKLAKRIDSETLVACCNPVNSNPWAIEDHARIIRESSIRRKMVRTGQKLIEMAQEVESIDEALAEMEKAVQAATEIPTGKAGLEPIADILNGHMDEVQERFRNRGQLTGVDTGFGQLNVWFGGWRATDLCIIAARPSMGKTAFMLQTAEIGAQEDYVAVFSVEMGKLSLADRLVSAEAMVPLFAVRNGHIQDDQWTKITDSYGRLETRNLFIDDTPNITIPYMRKEVRKLMRKIPQGKKLAVFVDYLQLIKANGRSRVEEVSEISRELKAMAKELNCCVIALAQLSRKVEDRQDKRPGMSDIKESGQIEQDADVIAFLYRDEYYNPKTEHPNVVEVIVGKNRNGPTGKAEITFLKEFQRFLDIDKEAKP